MRVVPVSDAPVRFVETIVWVSLRSGSVNVSAPDSVSVPAVLIRLTPEVSDVMGRSPPGVPLPPEKLMVCSPVVMTGASLVPVIVIVNGT